MQAQRRLQPAHIAAALFALPELFPAALLQNEAWRDAVERHLAKLMG